MFPLFLCEMKNISNLPSLKPRAKFESFWKIVWKVTNWIHERSHQRTELSRTTPSIPWMYLIYKMIHCYRTHLPRETTIRYTVFSILFGFKKSTLNAFSLPNHECIAFQQLRKIQLLVKKFSSLFSGTKLVTLFFDLIYKPPKIISLFFLFI